jgi:hypothetical protein
MKSSSKSNYSGMFLGFGYIPFFQEKVNKKKLVNVAIGLLFMSKSTQFEVKD